MNDDATAKYLSYCCPFVRCGLPHDVGFLRLDDALTHIAEVHKRKRRPTIKRWPHSIDTYERLGVSGVGPLRSWP